MAQRKPDSTRRSSTARKASGVRRARRSRPTTSWRSYTRRRPGLPTTIGAALGTLVVSTLFEASWPVRVGLVLLVLVLGLAYLVWKNRAEIASSAAADGADTMDTSGPDTPETHDAAGASAPTAAPRDTSHTQGEPPHE